MKENVLITGGAGFIGSHIAELIADESRYNVIIVDNLSTGKRENIKKVNAKFIEADIIDIVQLEQIFEKNNIDYIIHQAAQVSVSFSVNNPFFDAEENILGTINLLECALKYKIKKFIFASSAAVYGTPKYLPIDEHHGIAPISFYGLSKHTAEKYIEMYNKLYGLKYIIFRYANVYGDRQDSKGEAGVVSIFCEKSFKSEELNIHGDGKQTRDFVYVKDIAKANLMALYKNVENEIINVGTNERNSVLDLINNIEEVLNKDIKSIHTEERKGDIKDSYLDINKIKKLFDWEPEYQLNEGLREYLEHLIRVMR